MIPPMGEMSITVPALRSAAETERVVATPEDNPKVTAQQEPRPPIQAAVTNHWEGEAPAEPPLRSDFVEEIAPLAATTKTEPATAPTKSAMPINWPMLAIAAWLSGAFLLAALQLIRWQRFAAQTSASAKTPEWLDQEAQAIAKQLGCKPVPVTVCNRLSTPAVAGVIKPRILVPSALLDRLPRDRWSALLAHELAHVKRHDISWRMLELASGIVWFWNPIFWFARKQARTAAEHACDAWVVWALPQDRRTYANSLVDVSEWASTPSLPATAIGMSAASRANLEARLTSIVSGKISRHTSKAMHVVTAILLAASIPGWAIAEQQAQPIQTEATKSTPPTKTTPVNVAQAKPTQASAVPERTEINIQLDEPISIEFENEPIGTILEFISAYISVNIVLDHAVIETKPRNSVDEMEVVHVGPHWYKHPRREYLRTAEWPKSQVVDGMVKAFDGEASTVIDLLDKLLPETGMTYAITPDCIWITVAKSQFEISAPTLQPESWVWHPVDAASLRANNETVAGNIAILTNIFQRFDEKISFKTDEAHISEIAPKIRELYAIRPMPDGNTVHYPMPPIIVDAAAIAPPRSGDIPKSYLIANDAARNDRLSTNKASSANTNHAEGILRRTGTAPPTPVTSGMVPFVKLDNVPLKNALTALLRPLNLTYVAGPQFIYVTSPERAQRANFADRPVPPGVGDIGLAIEEPVHIEFDDQHVGTILEFVSSYVDINIVVDSRAVLPENISAYQQTGTKPVTTGHVPFIKVKDLTVADTLKALLTPLGLDYSVEPDFIWVSSPEFIATETFTPATTAAAPEPRPRPQPEPRPESPVRMEAATVTPSEKPGIVIDGKKFRRITRWENGDPRIEVEFGDNQIKWYEIGDTFQHVQVADIDVNANQVIIDYLGELRVLQLSWPISEAEPSRRPTRTARTTSQWTWTPTPYGNTKFGPIARWENSDPRIQVEFPNGERKWLEEGNAIGNAHIDRINIIANQVVVRTPENETRTFDLPSPVQVSSADSRNPKAGRRFSVQATWTPVTFGDITIGRLARWEDSGDPFIEVELSNGERKMVEVDQSITGIKIVGIDIIKNQIAVLRNDTVEVIQLPKPGQNSEVAPAPSQATRLNPRSDGTIGVGDQRWIDYIGDWSRHQ
jgi:beta-lactamase regulating signal transducer with metallopeptidase domain